jgi:hypothetical protein
MGSFGQHKKCGLKCILRKLMIAKNAAADCINLGTMAMDYFGKGVIRF